MSEPIEQLVERARNGDYQAASELVAQSYQRIFGYLRRLCGSDEDAADLTQRTFSKAWESLPSYAGRSSFSTWLHGIAYHVCVDWRRRRNPTAPQPDEWWAGREAATPSPFENAADRDVASQLYARVEQLPDEVRQTVHLHYYQGLSLAETAEVLGIASSTVKYRLREAIAALRARLAEPKRPVLNPQPAT